MTTAMLGDIAEFVNGFAFQTTDWHDVGVPIIRIQNLTDETKPMNLTTRQVAEKYRVRRGDLLVSWSATLGVFVWDRTDEAVVNQHIFRVTPKSGRVDREFLRHMLAGALRNMARHLHGATMKHVNRAEFLATEIPLPALGEQRRIASILGSANALRDRRYQTLELLEMLPRSIFADMFELSSPGGRNATIPLGDAVRKIENGTSPLCETWPAAVDEWGILKLGAVSYGRFAPEENKAYLGDGETLSRNEVRSGDVLMTRKNTRDLVGVVSVVGNDVRPRLLLPDLIFRLDLDPDQLNGRYFQALMMSPRKREEVRSLASGSAASMPNISKARLTTLPIDVPSIARQQEFSARVEEIDNQRRRAERALGADDSLFATLQDRAFRGEL